MKPVHLILILLFVLSLGAGCTSRSPNTSIHVSGTDIEDITPVRIGQFDTYTATFRIENPTNQSFGNVEVRFNMVPTTMYCHTQTQDVMIPVVNPLERKTEQFAFSEFADLNCEYTYTYEVTSDKNLF
ncbi:MAG: hypothetical protein ABSG49_03570 [Methanoregula sp.]|jgi:hypothetical protein|uniref:hypothetical protein n=1 Tax=Methanoregula sp. TaxID=2052170 RepID=UPI003C16297D